MRRITLLLTSYLLLGFGYSALCHAQLRPVPAELLGERIYAVVPMIGTGKADDPIRPKHTFFSPERRPTDPQPVVEDLELLQPEEKTRKQREQFEARKRVIGGFNYVLSDDKKKAIVEFVAADRAAFEAILRDPEVKVIDRKEVQLSNAKKQEAETELKKVKKDFDWAQLRTAGF